MQFDAISDKHDMMPGISVPSEVTDVRPPPSTTRQNYDIRPGCILWLPQKGDINERLLADVNIEAGCFNHPVMILSTDLVNGKATVFILTSFDGRDLVERYPTNRRLRAHHLPIFPSDAHPDNGILLFLKNNFHLRAKSYVKTEVKVIVNAASLIPYCRSGTRYKLKQSSYNTLAAHINFIPPTTPTQHYLRTTQSALPQAASMTPNSPVIISNTSLYPQIESVSQRGRRTPLGAYDPPSRTPTLPPYDLWSQTSSPPPHRHSSRAPPPDPDPFSLADLVRLLLLVSLGASFYGRHRLLLLGQWALKVMQRKWSDHSGGLNMASFLNVVKTASKTAVLDGVAWGLRLWECDFSRVSRLWE